MRVGVRVRVRVRVGLVAELLHVVSMNIIIFSQINVITHMWCDC